MTTRRLMRGRGPTQTFDPTTWQPMFDDDRLWVVMARVDLHEGETSHFLLDVDELGGRVLYVDVVTTPGDIPLRCQMPCQPIARIPAVGELVYVGLADGRLDFSPHIIAVIGNPGAQSGLAESTLVLQVAPGQKLLVHDGSATEAEPLVKRSEHNALVKFVAQQFDASAGHIHTVAGIPGLTTTMVTGTAPTPAPSPLAPEEADGTTTLEVK